MLKLSKIFKHYSFSQNFYDIIGAKEKQATQSGICFSCTINEQTSDAIGQKAPQGAGLRTKQTAKGKHNAKRHLRTYIAKIQVCEYKTIYIMLQFTII